jgi:hypothetical protein
MKKKKRCLTCRQLTNNTHCPTCQPTHHKGTYPPQAAQLRHAANTNPDTTCWRCGQPARPHDPWEAGHTPTGHLAPEHRSCNRTAGARSRS